MAQDATGVPWYFIGALHMRESGCNFAGVLHNGERIIGTGRLTTLEQKVVMFAPQGDRLTRVEVNIETIKDSLSEIKAALRAKPPRQSEHHFVAVGLICTAVPARVGTGDHYGRYI